MRRLAGILAALAIVAGCGGERGDTDGSDARPPAAEGTFPESAIPESAAAESAAPTYRSPELVPILPSDSLPTLRTYRMVLVNLHSIPALVYADAGADRVLLDTVPRLDSTRVNVSVQARELRLVATGRWGETLGVETVTLVTDSLVRWEVPNR